MGKNKNFFLLLSFIEGGSVMACELIGAKLLAPYFGTSLYVWAAALALTLGGLTLGYFLGGRLSHKHKNNANTLYYVLIVAAILLIVMPFSSYYIMENTINLNLEMGAILSLLAFMFPPLVFMGMVSPLIINLLTKDADAAGKSAGNVYAISTLGGILYTFLMGFYIIPNFGLSGPAIVSGIILAVLPLIALLRGVPVHAAVLSALVLAGAFLSNTSKLEYNEEYQELYHSEGILGQVKVVDHPSYDITPDHRMGRALLVNNTLQTYMGHDHNFKYSIWNWSHYFPTAASIFPAGSDVLLLGLGGGTIVKQLDRLDYNVEVVEIDERVKDVSIEFFGMNPNTTVHIDDARHYLKTVDKKYDIIIYDTFLSESVPEHLLTIEGFEDAKKKLKKGGMIMTNFYGYIKGPSGKAARSVHKTLTHSGFKVDILATPGEEANRNLIFLASLEEKDFTNVNYSEPNYPTITNLYDYFIDNRFLDTSDGVILSDKKPRLSKLYLPAAREWKKNYNNYYRKHFLKNTK